MVSAGKTLLSTYLDESDGKQRAQKNRREGQEDRADLQGKNLKEIMRPQEREALR